MRKTFRRIFLLCILPLMLFWYIDLAAGHPGRPDPALLCVKFADAGQADAALICSAGEAFLVDTGLAEDSGYLLHLLRETGVQELAGIVISHPHADHAGGVTQILEEVPVGTVYLPEIPESLLPETPLYAGILSAAAEKQIPVIIPKCGETVPLGDAAMQFLCTDNSAYTDVNDCTLCCRVSMGEQGIFFAGDMTKVSEEAMLSAGILQQTAVLKVAHHGSPNSTTPEFLEALHPGCAVISVGRENSYNHPSRAVLDRLRECGAAVWRTDMSGTLVLTTDGRTLTITEEEEPMAAIWYFAGILGGYLLGCINTAAIIARCKGFDIRQKGSGNAGASNALVTMGKAAAVCTAAVDILKAFLPVFILNMMTLPEGCERLPGLVGVCVILGHMFPFWMQFRGGKGFASLLGFALAWDWRFLLVCLVVLVLVLVITRYIALATIICAVILPVWAGIFTRDWLETGLFAVLGVIIVSRHIINLKRMKDGTEIKLGTKKTESKTESE